MINTCRTKRTFSHKFKLEVVMPISRIYIFNKNKKMLKVRGIFKVLLNILYDELKYSILKLAIIII